MTGPYGSDASLMHQRLWGLSSVRWVDDPRHKSLATRHSIVYVRRWS